MPSSTRSSRRAAGSTCRRMLTAQWRRVTSGITTCSRDPSGSSASTNGWLTSTRRPLERSIRSTRSCTWGSVSTTVVSSLRPSRAQNTRDGSLNQISSTLGSSKSRCSGPYPATVSCSSCARALTSAYDGSSVPPTATSSSTSRIAARTARGSASGSVPRSRTSARTRSTTTSWACACASDGTNGTVTTGTPGGGRGRACATPDGRGTWRTAWNLGRPCQGSVQRAPR